ncbi:MAG: hypothetical protein AB1782_04370 [Cyanobacteriota bacterium]
MTLNKPLTNTLVLTFLLFFHSNCLAFKFSQNYIYLEQNPAAGVSGEPVCNFISAKCTNNICSEAKQKAYENIKIIEQLDIEINNILDNIDDTEYKKQYDKVQKLENKYFNGKNIKDYYKLRQSYQTELTQMFLMAIEINPTLRDLSNESIKLMDERDRNCRIITDIVESRGNVNQNSNF